MKRGGHIKRTRLKRSAPKYVKDSTGTFAEKLKRNRAKVFKRDRNRCKVCGGTWGLQVHHIVPRARGVGWSGLHDMANLVLVCVPCHQDIHAYRLPEMHRWLKSRPPT